MNIYDLRLGAPDLICDPGFRDQDIEIGDRVTIVAPPVLRMGGWFAHPWVGHSGVVVDYQRRPNNEPYGRVIEIKDGDVHGQRVVVFDDRELRKGRV